MDNSSQSVLWLDIDGEVPSLMRRLDGSASTVGAPGSWPQQLQTLVGLALQARSPAAVIWGRELTTLYNDAYAIQLGDKHPASLGQSFSVLWSEIWSEMAPVIDAAMAGKSFYFENQPCTVQQVCLLDIGLPGIDGIELARRLRVLPETARAVLVAVTGYGQEQDREQTLAAGFDHHLVKPVDTTQLARIIAQAEDRS